MKFRTKFAALATAAAVTGVAGIAFAAWTSTVDGTGSARATTSDAGTGDLDPVTVVAANDLYPGAVKSTFVTITNDNDYPIEVTKIRAGSSRASGACAVDSVRTDEKANAGNAIAQTNASTLIAPDGTGTYELVLRMHNDASNDCKSASFVIGDRTTPANELVAEVRSAASTAGNTWP